MSALLDPNAFSVTAKPNGTCVILEVKGELDMCNAPVLGAELASRDGATPCLVIDLSEVTFIDSTGIHTLATACEEHGARVACPSGHIRRVFEVVSFSKICPLHETVEDALGD